ncbi:type II secretion system protein [Neobacillus niacini]|uniref:type II secretion system protein n=1 Tax=Neobacillus niacini TaxID=86668 RepID=UPI0005ED8568|nr:prepilin-type N-terminal cleavage/methylation domain-containing protein [Neobacillus niacini]
MQKYKRLSNEDGITLIEILATLAIVSIISILLYGVLLNGFDYSKKSKENVSLQQEMNIVVTSITKFHESYGAYDIIVDGPNSSKIQLLSKKPDGTVDKTIELSNSSYEYSLFDYKGTTETPFSPTTNVSTAQPLYIKIIIKDKKQPSQAYEVKTIISRL